MDAPVCWTLNIIRCRNPAAATASYVNCSMGCLSGIGQPGDRQPTAAPNHPPSYLSMLSGM